MNTRRVIFISVFSLLCSILFIVLLLNFFDFSQFVLIFENIQYQYYLCAFIIYIGINIIIAYRLYYFFNISGKKNFAASFDVGACHAIALCVLPLRLGDAVYPLLVKKFLNKSLASSVHNLIVLRIYDFISAAMLFVSLLLYSVVLPDINYIAYVLLFIAVVFSYVLLKYINKILEFVICISSKFNLQKIQSLVQPILIEFMNNSARLTGRNHIYLFLFSFIRWIFSGLMVLFICYALNIKFEFEQALYLTTGMNMAFIIPLQTIGGIGVLESVLALLLTLLGQSVEVATTTAISIRILWFVMPFILGAIWFSGRKVIGK